METLKTLKLENGTIELQQDRDERYRWYSGNESTEVSGATIEEATEAAYEAWPEIEQFNL